MFFTSSRLVVCFLLGKTAGLFILRPIFQTVSPFFAGKRPTHSQFPPDIVAQVFSEYQSRHSSCRITNPAVYSSIFKLLSSPGFLKEGACFHAVVVKNGFDSETSVSNSIMVFYNKCGLTDYSRNVFRFMVNNDSVSWNVMISGFVEDGSPNEALSTFMQARIERFEPNISTLVLVLRACCMLEDSREGKKVHGISIHNGYLSFSSIENSLLNFYAKSGRIEDARQLFDEMHAKDVISWSTMIAGYADNQDPLSALKIFMEMWGSEYVNPDGLTMVSVLRACSDIGDIGQLKVIHCCVVKLRFEYDVFVGNSLIDAYSKSRSIDDAHTMFCNMKSKNKVSWNSIISGLVYSEQYMEALILFSMMSQEGVESDAITMVNLLQSSKHIGDINRCKSVHSVVIRRGFETIHVLNSVMDAYMKCEMVELAKQVFHGMKNRNLVSWSTMIAGFTHCNQPGEAVHTFKEMQSCEKPNCVTMLSILDACTLLASLHLGKWAHGIVIRNGFEKEVAVGTAILNMYAKCGDVDLAKKVFDQMPEKNTVSWSAMISAYGHNGRGEDAVTLFREMKMQPNHATLVSLLSACSHSGLIDEGCLLFKRMTRDYGTLPTLQHYACMVDLFARAGLFKQLQELMKEMILEGMEIGASAWAAVLSACRNYGNTKLGTEAFEYVSQLEPEASTPYKLASNMYAGAGAWREVARMRGLVRNRRLKVVAGNSLIQVRNGVHEFVSGDRSHPKSGEIYATIELLVGRMNSAANGDNYFSC